MAGIPPPPPHCNIMENPHDNSTSKITTTTTTTIYAPAASNNNINNNDNNNNKDINNSCGNATVGASVNPNEVGLRNYGGRGYQHPFWFVNNNMPPSYWDYENATIEYNSGDPYELIQKIGRGKYSEVFRSRNRYNGELCVLKILKPVRLKKVHREITILENLCGGPNVLRLLDVVSIPPEGTPVLVTENIEPADSLRSLMFSNSLNNFDMRYYLYEILRCLHFAHSHGIFHRDIKPQNIIIDHQRRKLRIADWGLAEYYIHGQAFNVCVGTRHFKGPELLLGLRLYDYSLDIWSVGCILAEMLFHVFPFFRGDSNEDQLMKILDVFGSDELQNYIRKYDIYLPQHLLARGVLAKRPRKPWTLFVNSRCAPWCDVHALDLLDKMLRMDHQDRILAGDAMQHPFFDPIRHTLRLDAQEQYPHVQN